MATTGPNTYGEPLVAALTNENCSTIVHSQVRERNSLQPWPSSLRKLDPASRRPGGRCIAPTRAAAAKKVPASTAIAQPGLETATMIPPSAAPPM